MDNYTLSPLPPILNPDPLFLLKKAPQFPPLFRLPPLVDRPQNTIVDSLLNVQVPLKEWTTTKLQRLQISEEHDEKEDVDEKDIWLDERVISSIKSKQNQILSWDTLRPTFSKQPSFTPYLSEQPGEVFEAVRCHVRFRIKDPSVRLCYILPVELLDQLMINLVGNSSLLYLWDEKEARLVPRVDTNGARLQVIVDGLDEMSSTGVIQRFLNIGTLMRRLENCMQNLKQYDQSAIMHAFLHSVISILSYIRNSLTTRPPISASHLTSLWFYYSNKEELLVALAKLCQCDQSCPPFKPLPSSAPELLSHTYRCLQHHIERAALKEIIAVLAFILTMSSRHYFTKVGDSLGLHNDSRAIWLRPDATVPKLGNHYLASALDLDDIMLENPRTTTIDEVGGDQELPVFFSKSLIETLPAARKSLRILQMADSNCIPESSQACEWVWSYSAIEKLWEFQIPHKSAGDSLVEGNSLLQLRVLSETVHDCSMEDLHQFDLEPGTDVHQIVLESPVYSAISNFIEDFPSRLHPLTPTLDHLSQLVLQPLATQAESLSNSVLHLYLTKLRLEKHLVLMRSFMLATLPEFKRRLIQALFSDTYNHRSVGCGKRALPRLGLGMQDDNHELVGSFVNNVPTQGIGINPGLSEHSSWPPGGADLSFSLRNVIDESLEERPPGHEHNTDDDVWLQGESRLGFSIRDLPVEDGRERWLNPMNIEALDFLYLDYKPPSPLDVIMSREAMSKYHRTFTFLLRYFRVETVMRLIYRGMFDEPTPLFQYSPVAQSTAQTLRFRVQAFITAFGCYLFDSVIGINFDGFLQSVSDLNQISSVQRLPENGNFNVFHLRDIHSQMLDMILNGCFLRTSQQGAGGTLRELFDIILRFGDSITSIRQGRIHEAEAAAVIFGLNKSFHNQMCKFVMAIQNMLPKEQLNSHNSHNTGVPRKHLDMVDCQEAKALYLVDLLTRLDPMRWWRRKAEELSRTS